MINEFGLGLERLPDFSKFKKQQVKISEISKLTGVDFDPVLIKADVLLADFNETGAAGITFNNTNEITLLRR